MKKSSSMQPLPATQSRRLLSRFFLALGVAVLIHLLLLGCLRMVLELRGPSRTAEILATRQVESLAPDLAKLAAPVPVEVPLPWHVMDASVKGLLALPPLESSASHSMSLGAARQVFNGGGGLGVPQAMRNRLDAARRSKLLLEGGGLPEVEDAVQRALAWLATEQNEDGSWGRSYRGAMTGFAVLCFLGHGDTPESPAHGRVVKAGIQFLTRLSAKNRGLISERPASNASCYEHGIATYALGEAFLMAGFGQKDLLPVIEAFERGVQVILDGQTEAGGWLYRYQKGGRGDVSVTGWQYQALKIAHQTRLHFAGLEERIERMEHFLLSMRGPRGGFGYTEPEDRASLTGAGVLGLQLFHPQEHRIMIIEGLQVILDSNQRKRWPGVDIYAWYYNTQATFNFGGSAWESWSVGFQKALLENQLPEGCWRHASAGKAHADAQIFCTTLCTLMLEVFYRYRSSSEK